MKQPYYQLDFSAFSCKFQVKVNDIEILSLNLDGQTATDIPINAAIYGSGKQKVEVIGFPLDGQQTLHPEAYIRYKVVEQEVSGGQFMFVKDFEKFQTPKAQDGQTTILHSSIFDAQVPYTLGNWETLQPLNDVNTDITPRLKAAYQGIIRSAKAGDYNPLIAAIKVTEVRNAKTMYLGESELRARLQSILDDIANGFEITDLRNDHQIVYGGNGMLARLIRPDGNSAFVLENEQTQEELILDFWFCLPKGTSAFTVF